MMTPTRGIAQQIESDFPGWGVFQSDAGRWWASDHAFTPEQTRIGHSATVDADDPDLLRKAIRGELQMRESCAVQVPA